MAEQSTAAFPSLFPHGPLVQPGTVHLWTRNFLVSHLSACILNDLQSMHLSQTEKAMKADGTMSLTQSRRHEPNDLHWDSWVVSESRKMIDFIEHVRYSHNLNSIFISELWSLEKNHVGNPMPQKNYHSGMVQIIFGLISLIKNGGFHFQGVHLNHP